MVEEPFTKDVFRELDGFLVLVSMLSTLALPDYIEDQQDDSEERLDASRIVFAIISEAMRDHPCNADYFQVLPSCQSFVLCSHIYSAKSDTSFFNKLSRL